MAVTPVPMPPGLHTCPCDWASTYASPVIRTDFDAGTVKVRRRFTKAVRRVAASWWVTPDKLYLWQQLFESDTEHGTLPMLLETPDHDFALEAWRFVDPPQYAPSGSPVIAWKVTATLEQLPYWG